MAKRKKIERLIDELAQAKTELASLEAELATIEEEWKEKSGWNRVRAKSDKVAEKVALADQRLRDFVLRSYRASGRQNVHPNAFVQLRPKLEYNPDVVLRWVLNHEQWRFASVNKRAFNKYALQTEPEFVDIRHEPVVVIRGI